MTGLEGSELVSIGECGPLAGNAQRFDAFVSAASKEFGTARTAVATELRRDGLSVAVQEEFHTETHDKTTLDKLHDYIQSCDEVHCLIGRYSGSFPPEKAAERYRGYLPDGFTEASYTQWEYFFALRAKGTRLRVYRATDAWAADIADPEELTEGRPEAQARFADWVRREYGGDYAEFGAVLELQNAVLRNLRTPVPQSSLNDGLMAAGAGVVAMVFLALLSWAGCLWGGARTELTVLILAMDVIAGVAFGFLFLRYVAILGRAGTEAAAAYDRQRRLLAGGGRIAETYARRLRATLASVDSFFGDAWVASRPPLPRFLRLREPAPLWTPAALDRCLSLALLYPVVTVLLFWMMSGHVGPAEQALLLPEADAGRRAAVAGIVIMIVYCFWRSYRAGDLDRAILWFIGAVAGASAFALAVGGAVAAAVTWVALVGIVGAGALAAVCAIDYLSQRSTRNAWETVLALGLMAALILVTIGFSVTVDNAVWSRAEALVIFYGLLTLLNAPFDWASLGLTRLLLRRGLEVGGLWPVVLGLLDAALAAPVIVLLAVTCVLGVQAFDTAAWYTGAPDRRVLSLDTIFHGIHATPAAPEYWWVYALLLSTMVPSLVNLTIGFASVFRGIPWLQRLVLDRMPPNRPPPDWQRPWMALLLTLQAALGVPVGIVVQFGLIALMFGLILPAFGWGLLDIAEGVHGLNLPMRALGWLTGWAPQ